MACVAHLLRNFDEYTVAYCDRGARAPPDWPLDSTLFSFGNILSNVVVVNGMVRGAWRRTSTSRKRQVEVRSSDKLESDERDAVENADRDPGCFLETRELAVRL